LGTAGQLPYNVRLTVRSQNIYSNPRNFNSLPIVKIPVIYIFGLLSNQEIQKQLNIRFPGGTGLSPTANQNPELIARDNIDQKLVDAGWVVHDQKAIDFNAGQGIAVRKYQTDIGWAEYVLVVEKKAVGVIEVKPKDGDHKITTIEDQSQCYANATLLSHPKNAFSDQLVPQDPNNEHDSFLRKRIRLEKKIHIRHESREEVRIG